MLFYVRRIGGTRLMAGFSGNCDLRKDKLHTYCQRVKVTEAEEVAWIRCRLSFSTLFTETGAKPIGGDDGVGCMLNRELVILLGCPVTCCRVLGHLA